ncbi:hypothetical protein FM112_12315 [Gulosibacter sp. 10]|nr:hypothetical protein FM112_12315 [Gulosibacter sp. 10]
MENYPGHGELTIEESVTEVDTEVFYNLAGPVASSAMDDAQSVHGCSWGYGWEFVTWQWVVELDDEGLHALINGLRGDDGLTETSLNGVPVFEYEVPGGVHDTATIVYAFLDNVWIALVHGSDEMIADTIETLMAANPGLGAS